MDICIYLSVSVNIHANVSEPNKILGASEGIIFHILLWFSVAVCLVSVDRETDAF